MIKDVVTGRVSCFFLKADFSNTLMQSNCVYLLVSKVRAAGAALFHGGKGGELHLHLIFWNLISLTWPDFILGNALSRWIRREHTDMNESVSWSCQERFVVCFLYLAVS